MRDGLITLPFADGHHDFRLGWGELESLQEATDIGPYVLAEKLRSKRRAFRLLENVVSDGQIADAFVSIDGELNPPAFLPSECTAKEISAVIRIGLIGGGMKPAAALNLVTKHVEKDVPEEHRATAWMILAAGLHGAPEESLGESPAPNPPKEENSTTSPMES